MIKRSRRCSRESKNQLKDSSTSFKLLPADENRISNSGGEICLRCFLRCQSQGSSFKLAEGRSSRSCEETQGLKQSNRRNK